MFGFIKQYTPDHLQYADDEFDQSCFSYFDSSTSWNTILVHNIDIHDDSNHQEHVIITHLEKYIGKIASINDVYHNKYEKTIAITFAWWYRNDFTITLSDAMDTQIKVDGDKKIYKQTELFYFDEDGTRYSSLIEAV
tara:strand:+ start:1195 stop:1605 length:411 start_codon:yes stop_codon:yes gene_type:complete